VRAPVRLKDTKYIVKEPETSRSVPRSARRSRPNSSDRPLSISDRCAGVKLLVRVPGGALKGVSCFVGPMPCKSGSPQGVFSPWLSPRRQLLELGRCP